METFTVQALLDRPSPQSLGMLGLAIESRGTILRTEGVLGRQSGPISGSELSQLIADGHALRIEGPLVEAGNRPLVALWVGDQFAKETEDCDVILPPLTARASGRATCGTYWIAPSSQVMQVLESWLEQAFRKVSATRNRRLARLMSWVLPERDETRAAVWFTSPDERIRNRDLTWWARLGRDHGDQGITPESLADRLSAIIRDAQRSTPPRIIGLSGPAKGGDNEVAEFIAGQRHLKRASFGKWLIEQVELDGHKPDRIVLQRRGQEILDRDGALQFCLEVLQTHLPRSSHQAFVVDGIRHIDVLKSIRFLVGGADRFFFVSVDRPREIRRELLMAEERISPEVVDQVLDDPTEQEIPLLQREAALQLDGQCGAEHEGRRVLREVSI